MKLMVIGLAGALGIVAFAMVGRAPLARWLMEKRHRRHESEALAKGRERREDGPREREYDPLEEILSDREETRDRRRRDRDSEDED